MPPELLLTQLTGEQWARMKSRYSVLPTPLERIELLLSLIQHTIGAALGGGGEFNGSKIPPRSELYDEAMGIVRDQDDEDTILCNMHMHMLASNSIRGANNGNNKAS
jgi:hypothetical protein